MDAKNKAVLVIDEDAKMRRLILRILAENSGLERPLSFNDVWEVLDDNGFSPSALKLRELLTYLSGEGCVLIVRRNQLPGFRVSSMSSREHSDDILTVKLLNRGLDVLRNK